MVCYFSLFFGRNLHFQICALLRIAQIRKWRWLYIFVCFHLSLLCFCLFSFVLALFLFVSFVFALFLFVSFVFDLFSFVFGLFGLSSSQPLNINFRFFCHG